MDIVHDADAAAGLDAPSAAQPATEAEQSTNVTPAGMKSSPPILLTNVSTGKETEDVSPLGPKSDSEAETVLLPGVNGYSPTKSRKAIKLEDKPNESGIRESKESTQKRKNDESAECPNDDAPSNLGKRKRSKHGGANSKHEHSRNGNSSGLSSVPSSPVATTRSSLSKPAESDSDISKSPSPVLEVTRKEKVKSSDTKLRQIEDNEAPSGDEKEQRRTRRRRSSGLEVAGQKNQQNNDITSTPHGDNNSRNVTRSISPNLHSHRRTGSSNSVANGLSHKKRKLPPPLRATRDRHSIEEQSDDDSSVGESPHPRRSRTRNLATPPTGDSSVSLAKMPPHKKRNPFGRTALADACEDGDISKARRLLSEKPEDIDVADAAGNTPLQCASLNGHEDVVKLLLEGGCNIHCVNDKKDSPLLDAVENGHLEVVKLLLAAGVNPKIRNEEGEEPINKIDEDGTDAKAIRQALVRARANVGHTQPSAPVQSPHTESYSSRSRRTQSHGRSTKTGEHQLYTSYNVSSLRSAAARGDLQTVGNILQVIVTPGFDDPESLVAAARGGHEEVLQILLGFGNADPDPAPLQHKDWEHATPMLAAIGSDNIKVIELLLAKVEDDRFDPTKRYNGSTYYEIARQRQGPLWDEEERILKTAYENYKSRPKSRPQTTSQQGPTRGHHKKLSDSDGRSTVGKSKSQAASAPPQGPKRDQKVSSSTSMTPLKRGPGRPRKEGHEPTLVFDREPNASSVHREKTQSRRPGSDTVTSGPDAEPTKPRRKLISGKDLKGEREKQRRASIASIPPTAKLTAESLSTSSTEGHKQTNKTGAPRLVSSASDPDVASERSVDRARSIRQDDFKDRLTAIRGESPAKRPRPSSTPPSEQHETGSVKGSDHEVSHKRRRLESDVKTSTHKEPRKSSSPDHRPMRGSSSLSNDSPSTQRGHFRERKSSPSVAPTHHSDAQESPQPRGTSKGATPETARRPKVETELQPEQRQDYTNEAHSEKKRRTPEEEAAVVEKAGSTKTVSESPTSIKREEGEVKLEIEKNRLDEARVEQEAIQQRAIEEAAKRQQEEEQAQRREQERREQEWREQERREQERKEKERQEQERREQERREQDRREQERRDQERRDQERRDQERQDQERRDQERREQERRDQERREQERQEQEKREQERREELRKAEEERKRVYDEQLRLQREEQERRKAAQKAEQRAEHRRLQQEREAARLAKLPPLLRWFDGYQQPTTPEFASEFRIMQGVRYDTIRPEATGSPDAREQWLLNTQVALLLGEKDLQLSRYTAWERIPVSEVAKKTLWKVESERYAMITAGLRLHNGVFLERNDGSSAGRMSYAKIDEMRSEARNLFLALDLFFVKVSDFMFIVPKFPHLRNVQMQVQYREIPPDSSWLDKLTFPGKWRQDADAGSNYGFAPGAKVYVNGEFMHEDKPKLAQTSKTPFPECRVPRVGLRQVLPSDPDYTKLCIQQGLYHLVHGQESATNGLAVTLNGSLGVTPPESTNNVLHAISDPPSSANPIAVHDLPNGVNVNGV